MTSETSEKTPVLVFSCILAFCSGATQTVYLLSDYMAPIAKTPITEEIIYPSIVVFLLMFGCGYMSHNSPKCWKKYLIASSIGAVGMSLLMFNPVAPFIVIPLVAVTVGLASFLGLKSRGSKQNQTGAATHND